jgi:hypothetical protein
LVNKDFFLYQKKNILFSSPTTFLTKKESCGPIPSLMLIDFNRSIDLKLFDNGTAFVTCVPKKELACVEMLNNRPWIFQVTKSSK